MPDFAARAADLYRQTLQLRGYFDGWSNAPDPQVKRLARMDIDQLFDDLRRDARSLAAGLGGETLLSYF